MAKLIIEVLNRLGHSIERHAFERLPVRIGRGYHNDLIVTDPHVSPDHLVVHENDSGWRIEDSGSLNGVKIKHQTPASGGDLDIRSGDDVFIGNTRLRFFSPDQPMAETLVMPGNRPLAKLVGNPLAAAAILLFTIAVLVADQQLMTTREVGVEKLIANVLASIMGAAFWAGLWAFTGRVMRHRANYVIQLSASVLFVLALVAINNFSEYLTFISSSDILPAAFEYLFTGIALFAMLYVNLENATALTPRTRLAASHAVAWGLLLFALFMDYAQQPDFRFSPSFPATLKPPFAKLVNSQTVDDYLNDSEIIFKPYKKQE